MTIFVQINLRFSIKINVKKHYRLLVIYITLITFSEMLKPLLSFTFR